MDNTEIPHSVMVSQIEAAVLAERERCAQICGREAETNSSNPAAATAEYLAAAIRRGE